MKVYLLTVGEYDEWEIVNVFSSIEKLKKFKKDFPDEEYNDDNEEYELDNHPKIFKTKDVYWVLIKKDDEIDFKKVDKLYKNINCINKPYGVVNDWTVVYVWASNGEEAIKRAKKIIEKIKIFEV